MICTTCGDINGGKRVPPPNYNAIMSQNREPGVIGSLGRAGRVGADMKNWPIACTACNAATLIPLDSPIGKKLVEQYHPGKDIMELRKLEAKSEGGSEGQRPKKEMWIALVLTFVFGPLGLFYVSQKAAWIVLAASIVLGVASLGFLFWAGWVISMVTAFVLVNRQTS